MGLGHAVLMARELVGNEPFAVLLADDVIDGKKPCLRQMMDVFEESQCSIIATQEVNGPAISSYGVLDAQRIEGKFNGRAYNVRNLVEKPKPEDAPSNLAIIGRYILTPTIFETLERTPLGAGGERSEEHTSELQSHSDLVCRLLLEKKKHKPVKYI